MQQRELLRLFKDKSLTLGTQAAIKGLLDTLATWIVLEHGDLQRICRVGKTHLEKTLELRLLIEMRVDKKKFYSLGLHGEELLEQKVARIGKNPKKEDLYSRQPTFWTPEIFAKTAAFTKFCLKTGLIPWRYMDLEEEDAGNYFDAETARGTKIICIWDLKDLNDLTENEEGILIDVEPLEISGTTKRYPTYSA